MKYRKRIIGRWMGRYLDKEKHYKLGTLRKIPMIRFCVTAKVVRPRVMDKCVSFEWLNFWGYIGIRYTEIIK